MGEQTQDTDQPMPEETLRQIDDIIEIGGLGSLTDFRAIAAELSCELWKTRELALAWQAEFDTLLAEFKQLEMHGIAMEFTKLLNRS